MSEIFMVLIVLFKMKKYLNKKEVAVILVELSQ